MAQVMGLFTEEYDSAKLDAQIRSVLSELLTHNMLNVNLMYNKAETNIVEMVTWFPYEGNCANRILSLRVIDQCEYESNSSDVNIFFVPKKKQKKIPQTLNGCPLKVSSSVWEPYTYFDHNSGKFTKGIEVLLIKTIS
ncbi:hypothetical protein Bhyg_01176, partial [Pseudolycoriella hygida]